MPQYKILFTGPVGSGKTTSIHSVSDIEPVTTDAWSKDGHKKNGKSTVAMDYGMVEMGVNEKIHLYGTPGQERFNFMWDILSKGSGLGLVLLLDNTRPDPFQDMRYYLNTFSRYISETKVVIGVTQMDLNSTITIEDYQQQLNTLRLSPAVLSVDARVKGDVLKLVQGLFLPQDKSSYLLNY
ncbi:MAG: ATP/GTP-binding protein [Methylococcales bacterium]|nr:ATP/GTP-binding protein [Methylococcales bacterium]